MARYLSAIAVCFWGIACSPGPSDPDQKTLDLIHAQSGAAFSAGAKVLDRGDAGQPGGGCREWTVFDPNEITLPIFNNGHLRANAAAVDIQKRAQLFHARLPQDLTGSIEEFHSHWEKSNFVYAGTLLRTGRGDYLLLLQFKK